MNFLLIALKSRQYVQFAINAAISIKYHHPSSYIQLLVDNETVKMIPEGYKGLFESITKMRSEHYEDKNRGVFEPGLAKLNMYNYVSANEVIYLDADSILIQPINKQFENLQPQVVNLYPTDSLTWNCVWMPLHEYIKEYNIPEKIIHVEINSSFFYFRNSQTTHTFFSLAKSNYRTQHNNLWGGSFPDELAFNAAFGQMGIVPEYYQPLYFEGNLKTLDEIKEAGYSGISLWAMKKAKNKRIYEIYDRLVNQYSNALFGHKVAWKHDQLMAAKHIEVNKNKTKRKQTWRIV